jgi:AraC-like DNA-binding protein
MGEDAVATVGERREMWRFEAFRDAVSQSFVPLLAEGANEHTFEGNVTCTELGPLRVAQVSGGSHVVRRNSRLIRRADPACYKLSLQVAGPAVLDQDGRQAELAPGDLALYDTSRPYELRFDGPYKMIVLMFPRSLLQVPETSVRSLTGRRIPGDHGLATLIGPFVVGLTRQVDCRLVDRYASTTNHSLCDAVLNMLAAALTDELGSGAAATPNGPRQAALLGQIKGYVEDQLGDPDLGPASIAVAHHISPRYLRKLFEGEGDSVARWIRSRRLEHCRRDLGRLEMCDKSVSSVAARWGLTDAAHFSRLFKTAYGQSPRDYRLAMLAPVWSELSHTA